MFIAVSFSHKNADISLREKLNLSQDEQLELMQKLSTIENLLELMVISTCNRCEIYGYIKEDTENIDINIIDILCSFKNLDVEKILGIANIYLQMDAVHHIFAVASSLDSLVLGETQIVGQLKDAYKFSAEHKFCKKEFENLMMFAFKCSASVRNETQISKNPISISSVATNYALDFFDKQKAKNKECGDAQDSSRRINALIIGAGKMATICLKYLHKNGNFNISICNRTKENAIKLLKDFALDKINIIDFKNLKKEFNNFDLVFSAVHGGAIIKSDFFMQKDTKRLCFDLSMPRNICTDNIAEDIMQNIDVITIDDLKIKASHHIDIKRNNAREGFGIVGKFVHEFQNRADMNDVEAIIKNMRENAKKASLKEIEKAIKKGFIPEDLRKNIEKLIHNAFNEFLHAPTLKLKSIATNKNTIKSFNDIFV